MVAVGGERYACLALAAFEARGAAPNGEQAIAEHLRWVQVVRLRVDVDAASAVEQFGGALEGDGVEQIPRVGEGRLVDRGHLGEHGVGGVVGGKGEVDVDLTLLVHAAGLGTRQFDLELLEALESEFFAKAMHAGN